ncbi:hypothetical protein JOC70_000896 [Clostridium pascui]|nr:hypothetical protein [Clostridium pascui]MBM7869427.1 hypothetical protein [Clostridium pascui]
MRPFRGDKHQKGGKNDGVKPADRARKRNEKNPPTYETFDGEKIY